MLFTPRSVALSLGALWSAIQTVTGMLNTYSPFNTTICDLYSIIFQAWQQPAFIAHVVVDGKWVCSTQGTARGTPKDTAEEAHITMGRSLPQIKSRLFELTGTLFLSYVLRLQVSHCFVESIDVEHNILARGNRALELIYHKGIISVKSSQVN
jgi:hypothetical protein